MNLAMVRSLGIDGQVVAGLFAFLPEKLAAKVMKQKSLSSREPIKTWARSCTITPDFVGHTFLVHNGKQHIRVYVTEEMVGHKLGEFSPTRVFRGHSGAG